MNTEHPYDLLVIGGGINGAGIAADAAGRGLSVLLCEQNDLASATSSASSKLIHGGLRYLEYYDFPLVRESLRERRILFKTAPHLVHPLRFVVPYHRSLRSFWQIRLGLYFYDLMGYSRYFKRSKVINIKSSDHTNPLQRSITKGFIYSDCFVDDARLVITNALRVRRAGGEVMTRMKCVEAKRQEDYWQVQFQHEITKQVSFFKAKALVNATGPWAEEFIKHTLNMDSRFPLRLVKGSHIIIPKLHDRDQAYVLQHKDGRVVFVIPYLKQFTMIGTTDIQFKGDPRHVKIDANEVEYLCDIVNQYFRHPVQPEQVISSWSGVRTLLDDSSNSVSALHRGYKLDLRVDPNNRLPLINVLGGKLTTYRSLAEQAMTLLTPYFAHLSSAWTDKLALPGGDLPERNISLFLENLAQDFPWLPSSIAVRYAQNYGTRAYEVLNQATSLADLGQHFGHGLYEKEVLYLISQEWAQTCDDILWRRTKLGLFFMTREEAVLKKWIDDHIY